MDRLTYVHVERKVAISTKISEIIFMPTKTVIRIDDVKKGHKAKRSHRSGERVTNDEKTRETMKINTCSLVTLHSVKEMMLFERKVSYNLNAR